MQAASICFTAPFPLRSTKSSSQRQLLERRRTTFVRQTAAAPTPSPEASTTDYGSSFSVFPAEACETVGGEACSAEMFPEVKPEQAANNRKTGVEETVEREYLEYSEPKTVFPGEACDELGGEFCQAEYQQGVYADGQPK